MENLRRKSLLEKRFPERVKKESDKKMKRLRIMLLYIPLLVWLVVTVFPFYYMLVLATKSKEAITQLPPSIVFGDKLAANYINLLKNTEFWRNFAMSLYNAGISTILSIFFCSLAGYGFGMFNFKGKNFLFGFLLVTMMIPAVVSIVPFFAQMKYFGWLNLPRALYLPVIANAYGVFLMRQFTESTISPSLVEAARIDGASEIGIFFRVVLPLLRPALGTLGIITFLSSWNDFIRSLVVMTNAKNYTIPVALSTMQGQAGVEYGAVMLGSAISVLPLILVFALMSKWIISRLTEGAIKG